VNVRTARRKAWAFQCDLFEVFLVLDSPSEGRVARRTGAFPLIESAVPR
jgi:hypothetical protein